MLYTHSSSCPACPGPAAHVLGGEHPAAVQAQGMEQRPELPLAVSCFDQKHTGTFACLLHESSLRKTRKCPVRGGTHQMGEPTTKPGHVCGRSSWALFFFFFLNYSLTKGKASASLFYFYCTWTELSPAPQQGPSVTDHMSKWYFPSGGHFPPPWYPQGPPQAGGKQILTCGHGNGH